MRPKRSDDRVAVTDRRPDRPVLAIEVQQLDLYSSLVELHRTPARIDLCRLDTVEHAPQLVVETSRSKFERLWRIRQLHGRLEHPRRGAMEPLAQVGPPTVGVGCS